jgi:hypothetical protein
VTGGKITPRLLRAWRATDYVAAGAVVRIGRRCPALDPVLVSLRARTAVFVTAWNPRSRAMPAGWNRRMQRRLAEHLRRYASLPASGSLRRWHEAHLLVAADRRPVVRLARLFRQRGVVLVTRRQAAQLVLLDRGSDVSPASDAGGKSSLHQNIPDKEFPWSVSMRVKRDSVLARNRGKKPAYLRMAQKNPARLSGLAICRASSP